MSAYTITALELDFKNVDVRYRDIRNSLKEISELLGGSFTTYGLGGYCFLFGTDRALVFRKRNGHWEGIR